MSNFTQLGFVKQTDGENIGTWGDVLNDSLIDLLDDAIGGYVEVSVASGNVTLAFADGTADNNGRHAVIKFTGSPGTTRTVTFPNKQKTYYINNGSDGSVICTAGSGGATVTVLSGNKDIIYVDGSDEIHSVLTRTSVVLGTNTSGNILVADGNQFNSKAVGDLSAISTIASGDTLLAVDASGGGLKKVARSVLVAGLATSSALNNVSEDDTPQLGGNLDMNGNDIITTSNATIDLAPNGTGTVVVRGNTNSGAIVFNCESNSHGQTVIAQPHSAGVTNTMLLPAGASSTLVSLVSTDTLTNKTLTSPKINEDVAVTSTATELNLLDGITAGTVSASLAVIADSNKDISGFRNITLSGELDAGSLDVSGDADIDGTLEADAMTLNGTAITATATLDTGISNNNVPKFTSGVADDDFLRVNGTAIEGRSASEVLSDIGASAVAGSSSIVTTGALNSGSITSGFGTIDTGSSTITTTGLISGGSLDIDNVLINGTTIGHTDDTDLITVADGLVTVAGEVQMTTLDIGGTNVTSTAAELNYSDLATLGTTAASKVYTADANGLTKISGAALYTEDTLTDGSTVAWDVIASPVAKLTMAGNRTLSAPSGTTPAAGQFVSLLLIQDGTGSRTITFNAVYEFTGDTAPTLTTTANKGDLFVFRYNGSKWLEVGRNLNLTLS